MAISAFVRAQQAQLQKSVAMDVQSNQTKMENGASDMENNRLRQNHLEAEQKRLSKEAEEKADHNFFESIAAFFGDDGGAADAKRDLELKTAELEKNANLGSLAKEDQKDATAAFSEAIERGNQLEDGLKKAFKMIGDERKQITA